MFANSSTSFQDYLIDQDFFSKRKTVVETLLFVAILSGNFLKIKEVGRTKMKMM